MELRGIRIYKRKNACITEWEIQNLRGQFLESILAENFVIDGVSAIESMLNFFAHMVKEIFINYLLINYNYVSVERGTIFTYVYANRFYLE